MSDHIYQLTASRLKADVFCRDFPITDYLSKVTAFLGVPFENLHEFALLLLKPECQFGFHPSSWINLVRDAGFQHMTGIQFEWTPDLANSLWKYEPLVEGHQASDYIDLWATGPGYAAVFARSKTNADPATLMMTQLKGRSTYTLQKPGTIRKAIGQDLLLLTYVHTCDEPLDIVRELGFILDHDVRILPSTSCWPEQAFEISISPAPILNSASYYQLVETIAGRDLLCHDTTRRLHSRELFDWRQHLDESAILGSLKPFEKLLLAAANTRSTSAYTRVFPGVRQLYK